MLRFFAVALPRLLPLLLVLYLVLVADAARLPPVAAARRLSVQLKAWMLNHLMVGNLLAWLALATVLHVLSLRLPLPVFLNLMVYLLVYVLVLLVGLWAALWVLWCAVTCLPILWMPRP